MKQFKVGDWVFIAPLRSRAARIDTVRGVVTESYLDKLGLERCKIDWEDGLMKSETTIDWNAKYLRLV